MTKQPVSAGIYSTASGELIVYSESELAEEWKRLRNLPPDDLGSVIENSR
jgi:hypothetical protein